MVFNSLAFLIFIPIFFLFYFSTRKTPRLWVCLIGSYIFYGWWDWRFLFLIVFITWVNFAIGAKIEAHDRAEQRRFLILIALIINLGILFTFKYFNFFNHSMVSLLSSVGLPLHSSTLNIILPVGISFYTFQAMSYTLDIYWKKEKSEPSFLQFATYIAFFPQLVAGPIVRASHLLPQLKGDRVVSGEAIFSGLNLVFWGFFKKVVIADSIAVVVDVRFSTPELHTSLSLLIGVFLYAFQIYCDFSGYSDIAIGIARILGFHFDVNFNKPYFSGSFSEFWKRWHISLSSWLRDYLYIPLGGNRCSSLRNYLNLFVTMLLGGLWHGANWTFVIWGALHGIYLIVQRLAARPFQTLMLTFQVPKCVEKTFCILLTFALTCFAWIFFRAQSFTDACFILSRIISFDNMSISGIYQLFNAMKALFLTAVFIAIEASSLKIDYPKLLIRYPQLQIGCGLVIMWSIVLFGTFLNSTFIYFQF